MRLNINAVRIVARTIPNTPTIVLRLPIPVSPSPIASSSRLFSSSRANLKKSKATAVRKAKKAAHDSDDPEQDESSVVNLSEVLTKAKERMSKPIGWARAAVLEGVDRVSGRVTPSLLDGIKVTQKSDGATVPLNRVASITKRGNALIVDVWEHDLVKDIENAINVANLPGINASSVGETSIKVPIARPSNEQRTQLLKSLAATIETAKTQVRAARVEALRSIGGRGEDGTEQIQKITDDMCAELDGVFAGAKKEFDKA
ncbi:ribosome recycling factor-domain-containing protein [Naematelia encephala]|uniref:Ribosome recycling factor-domain-containing protein n=1 Tax=Naematelia encephala TaxID=71784 RepID=A0A1Y2B0D0_9TREE|nr:ribosome recycling factor-domain-containing protein [Naematelia encephala]